MALNLDHQRDRITTASGNITISTSGALRVPVGNTSQRPQVGVVATGQIRFNTQLSRYEGYNGSAWTGLGAVADADQDTYIETDKTADDDFLRFYTAGTERVTIDNNGKLTALFDFDLTGTFDNSSNTGAMILAQGTDAQRPGTPQTGMLRFSTTSNKAEIYDGSAWVEVGSGSGSGSSDSVIDADSDTHIKVETNADEDIIRFTTAGTERANINATGVLTIGDSAGTTFYSFPTARGTNNQLLSIDANGVLSFIDPPTSAGFYYQNNAPTTGLSTGQLWFDTGTTGELYVYTGTEWISTTPGADTGFIKQNYTGNGNTTAYNTGTGATGGTVSMVFVNGVLVQPTNDYTETGGIITFVNAPLNGDQIDVMITGSLVTLALNPLGLNNHNLITVDSSGELTVNSLVVSDLTDNRVVIAGTSGQIEDDANFTFDGTNLVVSTTGAVQLPAGTTAQRPGSAVNGMFRYNTTDNAFEGYASGAWGAIAGGGGIALTDLSITTASAGTAALSYDNTTGVFTYTPPDLSSYLTSYTETDPVVGAITGIVKADGAGNISAAVAGTDYLTSVSVNTAGDSGTGTVNLSTQTLSVAGTTNEIETSASGQTITVGLPNDVTITGALTVDTNTLVVDKANNRVGIGVASPLEKLHVDGAIRVDGVSTLKTSTATVASTSATNIDTFDATVDRSAKYIIQATNTVTEEYQIAEAVCIHDGATAYISIYGIIYTGSAEITTYSANYNSATSIFELQATGATANSIQYKVTRVNTLV